MKQISVVAALIENPRGELLLSQRLIGKAHAGLWEFPGGKIEARETPEQALERELREELGLHMQACNLFASYQHNYVEENVALTMLLYRIQWQGKAPGQVGLEGQALRWVAPARMHRLSMPAADLPAARVLGLPKQYLITPEPPAPTDSAQARRAWLAALERSVIAGNKLVLLRAKHTPLKQLRTLAALARDVVAHHGGEILLQDDFELCEQWRFGGVSLTAEALMRCRSRILAKTSWLAASCHNATELAQAQSLGCDFVTLAPVNTTATHPQASAMGWPQFCALAKTASMPLFALGGISAADLSAAHDAGAWGVAGIRGFWRDQAT
jgi:8-oxo-dGTP diphosphatase